MQIIGESLFRIVFITLISFTILFSQENNSFDDFQSEFDTKKVDSFDPLKEYNIPMTKFNDFIYMNIMGPIAKGYRYIVSKPIREGVSNIFHNIQFPIRLANNLLQLKFNNALEESARFAINSTFGLAGYIDLAKKEGGIQRHNEDFGQTLGFYGMSNDIHIVLPIFGPSNLRDTIGLVADGFISPINYAQKEDWSIFESSNTYLLINAYKITNEYSLHMDEYENIRKGSVNLYFLLKSVYEQRRTRLIEE
jgi:phospholipid-binding lipoprotein MlaA